MTLYEKWLLYTKNLTSPQSFIDFGFYFLISACLQRRVWFYDVDGKPIFCNPYIILVGPPAVGKGLVLGTINDLLRFHRNLKLPKIKTAGADEYPPLFPLGPDTITLEALLHSIAENTRSVLKPDKTVYFHSSTAFILEELSSLFKHKADDVVKLLIAMYDCRNYDYITKHQGQDRIRNPCVSFIAGTQVDFLVDANKKGITGQGWYSRTLVLFESTPRFEAFHKADLDTEQKTAREEILAWMKNLYTLYGEVKYSPEVRAWIEDWHVKVHVDRRDKAAPQMQEYMGRKGVMLLKLACAMHFAESTAMEIPLSVFERALPLLDGVEENMQAGLSMTGRNHVYRFAQKIKQHIKARGEVREEEIIMTYAPDLSVDEIKLCIQQLELGERLKSSLVEGIKTYYFK